MSTVHDAEPGDIYVDSAGKLWRCMATCHEPTVTFEEVEGRVFAHNHHLAGVGQAYVGPAPPPPIIRDRRSGGVTGLMWDGWKRIFRKDAEAA